MDAARKARRGTADQRSAEQRIEAAQNAVDAAADMVDGDCLDVPALRKAVDRLARQCGGVLPDTVLPAWRTVDSELLIAGDFVECEAPLVSVIDGFLKSLAAEFNLILHSMEAVHDGDKRDGSRISAGDYFTGVADDSPDELAGLEGLEGPGAGPAEEAGDSAGD